MLLWAEVVEALLDAGEMNPALWEAHCRKFIPEGRKLDLALWGLQAKVTPSAPPREMPQEVHVP